MAMKQNRDIKIFFQYVIPSVLSFALSGVYAIVDGFFIGNSICDLGLSAANIAYPVVGVIQALGMGTGMGGAIYYSGIVRRTDHDLVEHGFCTDSIGSVSSSPEAVCG